MYRIAGFRASAITSPPTDPALPNLTRSQHFKSRIPAVPGFQALSYGISITPYKWLCHPSSPSHTNSSCGVKNSRYKSSLLELPADRGGIGIGCVLPTPTKSVRRMSANGTMRRNTYIPTLNPIEIHFTISIMHARSYYSQQNKIKKNTSFLSASIIQQVC